MVNPYFPRPTPECLLHPAFSELLTEARDLGIAVYDTETHVFVGIRSISKAECCDDPYAAAAQFSLMLNPPPFKFPMRRGIFVDGSGEFDQGGTHISEKSG